MTLSESAQISLDTISFKVEKQLYDLNQIEKLALKEVYEEIQNAIGKPKKLDTSCNGCVKTAVDICFNFVKFHEVRTPQKPTAPLKPANVDRVTTTKTIEISKNQPEPTDLKMKFTDNPIVPFIHFSDSKEKTVKQSIEEHIDLKQLTIPELQEICREQGIKFHHKAKEGKLIELILNKQNEEAQ